MSSRPSEKRLDRARERADLARMRFATALDSTRNRVAPERIREDIGVAVTDKVEEAKQDLGQAVRKHPLMTAAGVAGFAAFLFWKPVRTAARYGLRIGELIWLNRNIRRP